MSVLPSPVHFGADQASATTYTLSGLLTDADENLVAFAQAHAALDAMTRTVPLSFRGWGIWRTMNPGGHYTLTLDIDAPEGQRLLTLSDVYSTSLYAYQGLCTFAKLYQCRNSVSHRQDQYWSLTCFSTH